MAWNGIVTRRDVTVTQHIQSQVILNLILISSVPRPLWALRPPNLSPPLFPLSPRQKKKRNLSSKLIPTRHRHRPRPLQSTHLLIPPSVLLIPARSGRAGHRIEAPRPADTRPYVAGAVAASATELKDGDDEEGHVEKPVHTHAHIGTSTITSKKLESRSRSREGQMTHQTKHPKTIPANSIPPILYSTGAHSRAKLFNRLHVTEPLRLGMAGRQARKRPPHVAKVMAGTRRAHMRKSITRERSGGR